MRQLENYASRRHTVRAVVLTREDFENTPDRPEWISSYLREHRIYPNVGGNGIYYSQGGPLKFAAWGDWLVVGPGESLTHFSDEEFREFYEPEEREVAADEKEAKLAAKFERALAQEFTLDGEKITVREYLALIFLTLWEEEEGFSGKRPLGNSGWREELVLPLVKAKMMKGSIREEDGEEDVGGYLSQDLEKAGVRLVLHMLGCRREKNRVIAS